jgi:hypothetical protein
MGMQAEKRQIFAEYERLIGKIKGVVSAKIITGRDDTIQEIHILAGQNRSPKQIVRDIESLFMAHYGLSIDHKKISIAQLDAETNREVSPSRLVLQGLSASMNRLRADVKVSLRYGEDEFEGFFSGPRSQGSHLRIVAQATLAAVQQCVKTDCVLAIEDISHVRLADRDAVTVAVSMITTEGEDILLGAAWDRGDERDAVAKALLSALNRRIPMLMADCQEVITAKWQ